MKISTLKLISIFSMMIMCAGVIPSNSNIGAEFIESEIQHEENFIINKDIKNLNTINENNTIYVDDDAPPEWYDQWHVNTIQKGIDYAFFNKFKEVFVYSGNYSNGGWSILLDNLKGLTITGENKVSTIIDGKGYGSGFLLQNCVNCNISGFTIQNTGEIADHIGIRLVLSTDCLISECNVQNAKSYGIAIENSNNNLILNCSVFNCTLDGILIALSSNNNEVLNCIIDSTRMFLIAGDSSNNLVKGNIISNNTYCGLQIGVSKGDSINNLICGNDFINNGHNNLITVNARDFSGDNYWSDYNKGNYWDNYIGLKLPYLFDRNGNGIGDIFYWRPYHVKDLKPLMEPNNDVINSLQIKHNCLTIKNIHNKKVLTIFKELIIFENVSDSLKNSLLLDIENNNTNNSSPNMHYVGGHGANNYTKIQDAINNASDFDRIKVFNGLYKENIIVNKKLEIIGNGSSNTIIDGMNNICVTIIAGNTTFSRFKITNGSRGINIISNNNNITENNILSNNGDGIWVRDSSKIIFSKNNISMSNLNGIWLINSFDNILDNNYINTNNLIGILIENSYNNIISNNTIIYNKDDGIDMYRSYNNKIISNNLSYNGRQGQISDGLTIHYESSNNIILKNEITNNKHFGIYIGERSNNNLIYLNIFINNGKSPIFGQNAWDECNNHWDNGTAGNYWDDYRKGGIWDFYPILPFSAENIDNHPIGPDIYDTTPPTIRFDVPKEGYLYFLGKEIISTGDNRTIIFCPILGIELVIYANDPESYVYYVNLSSESEWLDTIPNDSRTRDEYKYLWDPMSFGKWQKLIATAKNTKGLSNSIEIYVYMFNINLFNFGGYN